MKSIKRAFEDSMIQLCQSLPLEKLQTLDSILTQEKDEAGILEDIIKEFPNFKDIYAKKLAE